MFLSTRTATRIVAASNSAADSRPEADVLCDGTADNIEIQSAIDALSTTGGIVYLSEGTYTLAAQVTIDSDHILIMGAGPKTRLNLNASTAVISAGSKDSIALLYFETDAGGINISSATNSFAIYWNNGTLTQTSFPSAHDRSHNHSIAADGTTLTPAILNIPSAASPTPTTEGQTYWDSDDDKFVVGDGAAQKHLVPTTAFSGDATVSTAGAVTVASSHSGSTHHTRAHSMNGSSDHSAGTLGDLPYGGVAGAWTLLAGNITATKKYLQQTGTGAVSAAPTWDVIADADVPSSHSGSAHHTQSHNHSAAGDGTTISPAILNIPNAAAPTPTVEGQVYWDSDDDKLIVGDGAGQKHIIPTASFSGDATVNTSGAVTVAATHSGSTHHTRAHAMNGASDHSAGALGDVAYGGVAGAWTLLTGNITTTKKFLRQTGTGTVSAAPAWDTLETTDLPASVVETTDADWIDLTDSGATTLHSHAGSGTHNVLDGSTHPDSLAGTVVLGDIIHGNATPKWARLAGNITATKKYLVQTGNGSVSAVPSWEIIADADVPASHSGSAHHTRAHAMNGSSDHSAGTLGDVPYGGVAGAWTLLTGNITTTKKYLTQTGDGANSTAPGWNVIADADVPSSHSGSAHHNTLTLGDTMHSLSTQVLSGAAASATVVGHVELAITSEIDTGTDTTRAIPVDQYVASNRNVRYILWRVLAAATDHTVSTTVGGDLELPFTGTITEIGAFVDTAGTTNLATIDVNKGGTTLMTTNKITIDSTEKTSRTAATAPALTTTAVTAGDILTVDIDAIQTTAAKGLTVRLGIRMT